MKSFVFISKENCIRRVNNGFTAIELLGLLSWMQEDILRQMRGESEPRVISKIVVDKGQRLHERDVEAE